MTLQDKFVSQLRKDLEEQKRGLIEEAVEEYRETLNATLSEVLDRFVDNIHCSTLSQMDPFTMRQQLELRINLGDGFYATRYTDKGGEDKQQE